MDDLRDWHAIADALDRMPRGARSRLADALAMDRSQLARNLRRKGVYPDSRQASVIERFIGGQPSNDDGVRPEAKADAAMRVPEYGYAAASEGGRIALNEGQILDWADLPMGMKLRGEFFVIRTLGSSMEPRIWAGERKLVQRNVPPARNQDCVIEFHDGTGVIKTYRGEKDGHVFAFQYNPEQELKYEGSTVKALHAIFPL